MSEADQQVDINQILQTLERRHLDNALPSVQPFWGAKIERIPYLRIIGQARFWEDESNRDLSYEDHGEDLITGFHGQNTPFAYLLIGSRQGVEIYLALQDTGLDRLLATSLKATFPGIRLANNIASQLGSQHNASGMFNHSGRLTGIPTRKSGVQQQINLPGSMQNVQGRGSENERVQQIERLVRGMYGEIWGYLVWATPIPIADTVRTAYQRLSELTQVSVRIHGQDNLQVTKTEQLTNNTSMTTAKSQTIDRTDHWAQYVTELLERDLQRHQMGKAQGMWQTEVHFFAQEPEVLNKLKSLLRAIFAGEDSFPDPLRTFVCQSEKSPQSPDTFSTILTSGEVATMSQLPREEFPGYQVSDYARFDVDVPTPGTDAVSVGKVIDAGNPTGSWFSIERSDFAKHGLIVGVTGSGKTNTVFYLLDRLWNKGNGIPFLVIEPAKTEYRDLLQRDSLKGKLRIYTLGDERIAPFRINPFVFEIASSENRIHVQTHIDLLKSVFNAAFILYAPMPYVLDTCLHEIYQDKGWDLTTGQNRRLPPQARGSEHKWSVFPTLTDLYNKIDEVVDRLGYEERITRDVKAGLKVRIGSLRLGGKGLMLDTRYGVSMTELLSHPTLLELERVGNDDEKAFLIGLILIRLYEYRNIQAKSGASLPAIQHITIFEEAHRLLKNTQTEVGTEEANTRAQAVEAFANMLSEIRAYGQGVLIAEQIPTKLASDAIKNTNLKIMHRVVAMDDREIMGGAMNLEPHQSKIVAALEPGQAAAFAEGSDNPCLIQVVRQPEKGDSQNRSRTSDVEISQVMGAFRKPEVYDPVPGYSKYLQIPADDLTQARDLAQMVLQHADFPEQFSRYFFSLIAQPSQAVYGFRELLLIMHRAAGDMKLQLERQVATALILHALDLMFEERGRHYRWFYNVSNTLRDQLTAPLVGVAQNYENKRDILENLSAQTEAKLKPFIEGYLQQVKSAAPFVGCKPSCNQPCLYRWDLVPILQDKTLERDFVRAIQNTKDDQLMWNNLSMVAEEATKRILSISNSDHSRGLAVCFTAQMVANLGFSARSQKKAVQNVAMLQTQSS